MDPKLLTAILSRLSKHAFEDFVLEQWREGEAVLHPLKEAGAGVFFEEWMESYGGDIHSVYLTHYLPLDLFSDPARLSVRDPSLVRRLEVVRKLYEGKVGHFGYVAEMLEEVPRLRNLAFLINCGGFTREFYDAHIFPKYADLIAGWGVHLMFIGSYDSFVDTDAQHTEAALRRFILRHRDGMAIVLSDDKPSIVSLGGGCVLDSGVLRQSEQPCEPVFVSTREPMVEAIVEFESLVKRGAREANWGNSWQRTTGRCSASGTTALRRSFGFGFQRWTLLEERGA